MMDPLKRIIGEIELHSVAGIIECFEHGVDPNQLYNGEPLIYELTSEYLRSPVFSDCVRAFVDHGLVFEDKPLLYVLMNDAAALESELASNRGLVGLRYTLRSAYTPLEEVTLLHICAEFNHVSCAKLLIEYGANVNAPAGLDEHGFGGQTPIFHTVNQNRNQSVEMMDLLVQEKADLVVSVRGIIWGKGYPWETLIPAVNPISYAMMGLLPQMHRDERVISEVVMKLINRAYGLDYRPRNVPNKYLGGA